MKHLILLKIDQVISDNSIANYDCVPCDSFNCIKKNQGIILLQNMEYGHKKLLKSDYLEIMIRSGRSIKLPLELPRELKNGMRNF